MSTMRKGVMLSVLAATACIALATPTWGHANADKARTATDASGGSYHIGVLAPETGPLAPYGTAIKQGFKVAVELINASGGIGGKPVAITLRDSETDPKVAATQAERLLSQGNIDAIVGTQSSATTLAVIPKAERHEVPFLYIAEGEDKTCDRTGRAPRKFVFGIGPTPYQKMKEFVPYLLKHLGTKVYFIGSDYVFPHLVNETTAGLIKQDGGKVVGITYAPLGTSNFTSYIAKIRSSGADVLFTSVVGTDGVALVNQLKEFGIDKQMKITGIPGFAAEVLSGETAAAQGVYTVIGYWDGNDNEVNRKFVSAFKKAYPKDAIVPPTAAIIYSSLLLLQEAARKTGSTSGPAIAAALPGLTVSGPDGDITVNASNHVVTRTFFLVRVRGSGYELIKRLGSVPHPAFLGCSSKNA